MSNAAVKNEVFKPDVKLCYPFIEAVVSTMKVQCQTTATPGKPTFKDPNYEGRVDVLISATINSSNMMGSVNICFSKRVFLSIMGKMLGESFGGYTAELEDAAKELINIVFNQAKKPLAEKGMAAVRSIPNIIFGDNMKVRYLTRGSTILLPFDTELGPFSVEITTQDVTTSDSV